MAIAEVSRNSLHGLQAQTMAIMKALVYHGHGEIPWKDKPGGAIRHPDDAMLRRAAPA